MHRLILTLIFLFSLHSAHATTLDQLSDEIAQKKFTQAVNTGNSILKTQPDNAKARFMTALALQQTNKIQQAEEHYLYLIKTHPDFPEPRNNLAIIYLERGQHDEAAGLLIASLKTHPSYAIAWNNLSDLYKGLASEAYRKALGEENPVSALDNIKLSTIDDLHSLPEAEPKPSIQITKAEIKQRQVTPPSSESGNSPTKQSQNPTVNVISTSSNTQLASMPQASSSNPDDPIFALHQWANAWSSKAFNDYINAYIADYRGLENNRQQWLNQRKSRIDRPGKISVILSNIEVRKRSKDRVTIDAQQSFESPSYKDKVVKRFILTKIKGQWKISRERTLTVL